MNERQLHTLQLLLSLQLPLLLSLPLPLSLLHTLPLPLLLSPFLLNKSYFLIKLCELFFFAFVVNYFVLLEKVLALGVN